MVTGVLAWVTVVHLGFNDIRIIVFQLFSLMDPETWVCFTEVN